MDWLHDSWQWIAGAGIIGIGIAFAKKIAITIAVKMLKKYVTDDKVREWFYEIGKDVTGMGTAKLGEDYNKLEGEIQRKIRVGFEAFQNGLDSDEK